MELIRPFSGLGKGDVGLAGGKGASLGEMTQAGIPVPPGFVILADAFERFLEEADLNQELDTILHSVNHQEIRTVDLASEKIRALITGAKMPDDIGKDIRKSFVGLDAEFVAVRSSATAEDGATAAWAGQLDTFLNTTEEDLLENVQRCWASLFTPRAIFYRFEKGMHGSKISVAVVVQKMVQSEVSGIAFSVHPVTEDYNQLIIEAGFGLGEAIVSGQVTPDSYVVEKVPRRIIDKNTTYQERALARSPNGGNEWVELSKEIGEKPALTDEQTLQLAEIVLGIEQHYGFPCDIEWAFEAGQFFITQSRPITTLAQTKPLPTILEKAIERDSTFATQQFFARNLIEDLAQEYGISSPYRPIVIHTGDIENIRLFENKQALHWIQDRLVEKCIKSPHFISELIDAHKKTLSELGDIWEQDSLHDGNFGRYLELIRSASLNVTVYFYAGIDPRIPKDIADQIIEMRKIDELGARNDEFIRKCVTSHGLDPELARVITINELCKPDEQKLKARIAGAVLVDGELIEESFDKFTATHPQCLLVEERAGTNQEARGNIAMKGFARGQVRIVKNRAQAAKVQPGDILIAPMTQPDFLQAMQKSAAFVTDEGGIVCHAAVLAREMGKPCVIGTKVATQVFKDGDMVEVDANEGIVRRLQI
jgi:phosphoenolpyruvate synthase/pyruvate phosphate dikinase